MPDGLMLQPEHIRRINDMLRWYEPRKGVLDIALRKQQQSSGHILTSKTLIPCEAKDDLTPGFTNKAFYPMKNDMSDADTSVEPILVNDIGSAIRAYGRDTTGVVNGSHGARGFYCKCNDGNNYLVQCQHIAQILGGTAQVDASKNLTGLTSLYSLDGGQLPFHDGDPVTTLTASTTPAIVTSGTQEISGSTLIFIWDEHSENYRPPWPQSLRMFEGTLPTALTATASGVSNCTLVSIDRPGAQALSGNTVYNVLAGTSGGFAGAAGTPFKAVWNCYRSRFEFIDMPCSGS